MLSIHGNEKGGREGGLRVIEDFVRNLGVAREGATGHAGKTLYDLLDQSVLLFHFANADGWAWDEPQYAQPADCGYPGFFKRYNGNCTDLNRQFPTTGWQFINPETGRISLSEPEPRGYTPVLTNYTHILYAADIHGMLNPADAPAEAIVDDFTDGTTPEEVNLYGHFVLGLISAGRLNPQEMLRSTRLAKVLDDRLNSDPTFAGWSTLPSAGAWGGEYYSWSTVWDTIGYTDSGISGDFFLQDTGLNAPGMNFEMAYNHITFDSAYPGAAQAMNLYHVQTVRQIVRAYLEAAVTDVQTAIEAHGKKTAYLYNPTVVTDKDDSTPLDGWAAENPFDDPWDVNTIDFESTPNDYFRDLKPFMKDGDAPAVFDELLLADLSAERLKTYDNLVVAGSAAGVLGDSHVPLLKQYVEAGGNLVLTDEALKLLRDLAGLDVDSFDKYAGMTLLVDRDHPLAANSVKLSRQTYEPVPIGYSLQGSHSPVFFVNRTAFEAKGGVTVGTVPHQGHANLDGETNLGVLSQGAGTVTFLGALLPDATEEFYHPYGLDSYATTYFGNLLLYNMIGAEQVFEEPPVVLETIGPNVPLQPTEAPDDEGSGDNSDTPGFAAAALLGALALLVFGRRRGGKSAP